MNRHERVERDETIRDLVDAGLSGREVAKQLGCSHTAVQRALSGIAQGKLDRDNAIRQAVADGTSPWVVSETLGISLDTVRRLVPMAAIRAVLLDKQGGKCAICKTTDSWHGAGGWCIDHDHATGLIRGVLCNKCNKILGQWKDSTEILQSAIAYLLATKQKPS